MTIIKAHPENAPRQNSDHQHGYHAMHKSSLYCALIAAFFLLVGCSTDPEQSRAVPVELPTDPDGTPVTRIGPTANFDPSAGVVPTPNNLVYAGSVDGTLNLPVADPANFGDPLVALNAQDGWSTTAPMVMTFSAAVDPATVIPGQSVRVFQVTLSGVGGAVTGVTRELAAPAEFVAFIHPADTTQTQLVILPTRPLAAKSHFAVVITNDIADAQGGHVVASQIYHIIKNTDPLVDADGNSTIVLPDASAQALEPLRQLTNAREAAVAAAAGPARDRIMLSWTVSTQSITDVIDHFAANTAAAATHTVAPFAGGVTTSAAGGQGFAQIRVGRIAVPYGLQAPGDTDPVNPARILSGHWQGAGGSNLTRFNPAMVPRSTQTIPMIVTVPIPGAGGVVPAMPAAGWPVVIFQHGIGGNRTHAIAIADSAARAGFVVVSIDQPLHGITDTTSSFYATGTLHTATGTTATERHFNVDLVDNSTGAPGADGTIDTSGTHFINLARLLTSRDNLRQTQADLLTLIATIPSLSVPGTTIDSSRIHFVGHSLGAMAGIGAIGANDVVASATLAMPGGGIARLLDASATFGPRIRAGLAAAGVQAGTPAYDQFMFAAQTIVDSADPINHGRASANAPIHMIAVVGDGGEVNLTDQVVPFVVPTAPLSGTSPLAAVMGLTPVSATTENTAGVRGLVRFVQGDHGSIISTTASAAATTEMQTQMATFMATFGTTLRITNEDVVQ